MLVPIRWLKEYVEIPVSVEELAHRLTMAGVEVASIEKIPSGEVDWKDIIVGQIVAVERHPNADRLSIAKVNCGDGVLTSVTGAPNIKVGMKDLKVAVAKLGARIMNAYATEPTTPVTIQVQAATLRGVDSQVVLCSEKELGLSDDHTDVMLLEKDATVGAALVDLLGDQVLEIELTPNLGRCLSVIGIAREVAALTGSKLHIKSPKWKTSDEPSEGQAKIEILDDALCPRYSAALIKGVKIKEAPFWMRYRLMLAGMRPINSIVDISNYVMLEWGQPLHAFDYDKLVGRAGGKHPGIIIRRAQAGEKLVTLDKIERQLTDEMLMICDEKGPIALAGVMGGLETEVSGSTKNILLESANFHAINNRKTAMALLLPSEASQRYTRGVPPESTELGAMRAADLMRQISRGTIARGLLDVYPKPRQPKIISLPIREVKRLLGIEMSAKEISEILKRLEFKSRKVKENLEVSVPYYRLDVEIPADLIEEVARVIGYDRLPSTLMSDRLPPQKRNRSQEMEERVRDLLAGMGLTEVVNYSLTNLASLSKLDPSGKMASGAFVELANPISTERSVMRSTLMNGLLESVAVNQRHQDHIGIFEVGRIFLSNPESHDGLPDEPRRIGIALAGSQEEASWTEPSQFVDFYALTGAIEALFSRLGLSKAVHISTQHPTFHPGRSAEIRLGNLKLGVLGEAHPEVAAKFDLRGRVYLAELDLETLIAHATEIKCYEPLPRFPGIRQDIAVVVDLNLPAKRIEDLIRREGGELLRELTLFDVYEGKPLPDGKKSLAYALDYRADERTLKDEEAQAIHLRIQSAVEKELSAQVRGAGG
ncbi:phenylalanine--tRNA ligase subunit beta [Candidatus Acetothermia bacterium]|nr:phenylalanine--tRNA ligase subunit beta [Candidatus Acetothermia bacterium]MBI3643525.1 phenylalanine--tRNA ligase subunit beta [Candidatus Acetothermia bacterium]